MDIIARELRPDDLEECLDLVCCRPHYAALYQTPEARTAVLAAWKALLGTRGCYGGLTENLREPKGRRIVTFGFSTYVRESWLETFLASPFPFFGPKILADYAHGNDVVILSEEELRTANSSCGLSGVVLLMGWDPMRMPEEHAFEIKQAVVETFRRANAGYRIHRYIIEVLAGYEEDFHTANSTWRPWSRYEDHYADNPPPPPPAPVLIGMSKKELEAEGQDLSVIAPLFVWRDVLFCFTPEQQRLLLAAQDHDSDAELAQSLGMTMEALRRRLARIYRRVSALQHARTPVFPPNAAVGAKRRLLLQYLDTHPEELRPHNFRKRL